MIGSSHGHSTWLMSHESFWPMSNKTYPEHTWRPNHLWSQPPQQPILSKMAILYHDFSILRRFFLNFLIDHVTDNHMTHVLPIRTYKLHTTQANAITWKVMLIRIRFRSLADIERRFHFLNGGKRDVISNLWWHSLKSGHLGSFFFSKFFYNHTRIWVIRSVIF